MYSFSHAYDLMARIPEITWLINEMRRSETAAVRERIVAPAEESPPRYGRGKHRKMIPIEVCQPIKWTSK